MSIQFTRLLVTALLLTALAAEARADFLIYDLKTIPQFKQAAEGWVPHQQGGDTRFVLFGRVMVAPSHFVIYKHPNGTTLHFLTADIRIVKAPTPREEFNKRFTTAGSDPGGLMQAGVFALKKGLIVDFYRAVDKVLEVEPQHKAAERVSELRKQLKTPLPIDPEADKQIRSIVPRPGMRLELSNHFILMTDTDRHPREGSRKTRAHEWLDLLETYYERFLLLFNAQGVQLDIPQERMLVVLFQNQDDFREYDCAINPSAASASGFWDPLGNVTCFFDNPINDRYKLLTRFLDHIRKIASDTKTERDPVTISQINILKFLLSAERENLDMTAVSRECCRQLAGNTGLLPRRADIPIWIRDGLATYFEVPSGSAWAGSGAVTEERLKPERALSADDRKRFNIDAIVTGSILADLKTPEEKHRGAVQEWSLTHFLMESHLQEFVAFCRLLGGRSPTDAKLSADILKQLFSRAFGVDSKAVDAEWRGYMRVLKTDIENLDENFVWDIKKQ